MQAPMSFHDIVQNHPFVLKGVLLDVWQELPGALREKITFHAFIYNSTDFERYTVIRIRQGIAVRAGREAWLPFFFAFFGRVRRRHQPDSGQHSGADYVSWRPRWGVPEFSATTASSMPGCIPAREWRCLTPCVCGNWWAPCCGGWLRARSTPGFCHRLPRPPRSETFRRTRRGCGKFLQSVRW